MTKDTLLNQDTNEVLDNSEKIYRATIGSIILAVVLFMVFLIHYCTVIAENKALQSKCDSLEVSNASLEANLLMPQMIKETNLKTE